MSKSLIDSLRGGAELESRGSFTLDADKAREKMKQYRLADPAAYVLEWVQCGVAAGASQVDIRVTLDLVRLRMPGATLDLANIAELWNAIFAETNRARTRLALGVNGAMRQNWKSIKVTADSPAGGWSVSLKSDTATDEYVERQPTKHATIEIELRKGTLTADVKDLWRAALDNMPEEVLLRERCALSQVPIHLDGQRIGSGFAVNALISHVVRADDMAVCAGINAPADPAPGKLLILTDGVFIESLHNDLPDGIIVIADAPTLKKGVSQARIVRDTPELKRLLSVVGKSLPQLIHMLAIGVQEGSVAMDTHVQRQLKLGALRMVTRRDVTDGDGREHTRVLRDVPLFHALGRGPASVNELKTMAATDQGASFVSLEGFGSVHDAVDGLVIVAHETADRVWLRDTLQLRDVTVTMTRALRNLERKRAWLSRRLPDTPALTTLLEQKMEGDAALQGSRFVDRSLRSLYIARAVSGEGAQEIRVSALLLPVPDVNLFFVGAEGSLLCEVTTSVWPIGFVALLNGPLRPVSDYSRPKLDAVYAEAVLRAVMLLPRLLKKTRRSTLSSQTRRELASVLVSGRFASDMLVDLGFSKKSAEAYIEQFERDGNSVRWNATTSMPDSVRDLLDSVRLQTVGGRRSLLNVLESVESGSLVPTITETLRAFAPREDAIVLAEGVQSLLEKLLPRRRVLKSLDGEALLRQTREGFYGRPAIAPVLARGVGSSSRVTRMIRTSDYHGQVGLRPFSGRLPEGPGTITAVILKEGRTATKLGVHHPAGALFEAIIEAPAIEMTQDYAAVEDPALVARIEATVAEAVTELVLEACAHVRTDEAAWSAVALAVGAVFPATILHRAFALNLEQVSVGTASARHVSYLKQATQSNWHAIDQELQNKVRARNHNSFDTLAGAGPTAFTDLRLGTFLEDSAPPSDEDTDLVAYARDLVAALESAQLFITCAQKTVTVGHVRAMFQGNGSVEVCTSPDLAPFADPDTLLTDRNQLEVLGRWLSPQAIRIIDEDVRAAAQRVQWRRERVEQAVDLHGQMLVASRVTDAHMEAMFGLPSQVDATVTPLSSVRLLLDSREVERTPELSAVDLRGVVNARDLQLSSDMTATRTGESWDALRTLVRRATPPLFLKLLDRWSELNALEREAAFVHLCTYFAHFKMDRDESIRGDHQKVLARTRALPALHATDGSMVSIADLMGALKAKQSIGWISRPPRSPRRSRHVDLVVILHQVQARLILRRVRSLKDVRKIWDKEQVIVDRIASAPEAEGPPSADPDSAQSKCVTQFSRAELRGSLWWADMGSKVQLTVDDRVVATLRASLLFPCAGAVSGNAISLDNGRATLPESTRLSLQGLAYEQYVTMFDVFERGDPGAEVFTTALQAVHRRLTLIVEQGLSVPAAIMEVDDIHISESSPLARLPGGAQTLFGRLAAHFGPSQAASRQDAWSRSSIRGDDRAPDPRNNEQTQAPTEGMASPPHRTPSHLSADPELHVTERGVQDPDSLWIAVLLDDVRAMGSEAPDIEWTTSADNKQLVSRTTDALALSMNHPLVVAARARPDAVDLRHLVAALIACDQGSRSATTTKRMLAAYTRLARGDE